MCLTYTIPSANYWGVSYLHVSHTHPQREWMMRTYDAVLRRFLACVDRVCEPGVDKGAVDGFGVC